MPLNRDDIKSIIISFGTESRKPRYMEAIDSTGNHLGGFTNSLFDFPAFDNAYLADSNFTPYLQAATRSVDPAVVTFSVFQNTFAATLHEYRTDAAAGGNLKAPEQWMLDENPLAAAGGASGSSGGAGGTASLTADPPIIYRLFHGSFADLTAATQLVPTIATQANGNITINQNSLWRPAMPAIRADNKRFSVLVTATRDAQGNWTETIAAPTATDNYFAWQGSETGAIGSWHTPQTDDDHLVRSYDGITYGPPIPVSRASGVSREILLSNALNVYYNVAGNPAQVIMDLELDSIDSIGLLITELATYYPNNPNRTEYLPIPKLFITRSANEADVLNGQEILVQLVTAANGVKRFKVSRGSSVVPTPIPPFAAIRFVFDTTRALTDTNQRIIAMRAFRSDGQWTHAITAIGNRRS